MIQDIYPHRLNNAYSAHRGPVPGSYVFCFRNGALLSAFGPDGLCLPTVEQLGTPGRLSYLFSLDDLPCFLYLGEDLPVPGGYAFRTLRELRQQTLEPRGLFYAAYTAYHLDGWMRQNRFCGTCGHETEPAKDERALDCSHCGRRIYPRLNPAVIVGVTNGDRLLLTRYANRGVSYHALVAGFVEIGETLEETVAREVMEETGLKVRNIRYYKSQPWGIASDILAGFYCDVDGSPAIRMDTSELKEAAWFSRGDIVGQPDDFSLTNEMMMRFKEGREPR